MTKLCPRCRSIQNVRISTNTTYTVLKKGENKGKKKKVLITVYHCEGCNSYLGSNVEKELILENKINDIENDDIEDIKNEIKKALHSFTKE